ncbi:MAG TPA: ATP phosphoribosyltransferase regulatory subunit [Thermaerobacter sp.]
MFAMFQHATSVGSPTWGSGPVVELDREEAIRHRLATLFARWGYRRIRTPIWEEAGPHLLEVFPETALCRFVDPSGRVLALRPDHTLAVARWAAPRFRGPDPWRLSYVDAVYRRDPRDGQFTAVTQAGVELLGLPAPAGDVELLGLLLDALDALALHRASPGGLGTPVRVAVGHVGVLQALLADRGVDRAAAGAILAALVRRDRVALRRGLEATLGAAATARLYPVLVGSLTPDAARRWLAELDGEAAASLAATLDAVRRFFGAQGVERIRVEPGLVRDLQYYTGLVVEVFAGRRRIGAGGRYDGLLARFGGQGPAVGLAFDVEAAAEVTAGEAVGGPAGPVHDAVAALDRGEALRTGDPGAGSDPRGPTVSGTGAADAAPPRHGGPWAETWGDGVPGRSVATGDEGGAPHPGLGSGMCIDYLVAGPDPSAGPAADGARWTGTARLWEEARRLRAQGASAVVMPGLVSEEQALAAARRLGCLRLLWLEGPRRVLRMAWPAAEPHGV